MALRKQRVFSKSIKGSGFSNLREAKPSFPGPHLCATLVLSVGVLVVEDLKVDDKKASLS